LRPEWVKGDQLGILCVFVVLYTSNDFVYVFVADLIAHLKEATSK